MKGITLQARPLSIQIALPSVIKRAVLSAGPLSILIALLSVIMTAACSKNGPDGISAATIDADGRKIVVTSFYPMHIAALNVIGGLEGVRLMNMTLRHSGCAHDYQLTPADAALIEKAEVLIVNGGGMEAFTDMAQSLNRNLVLIDASAGLALERQERRGGGNAGAHAWMNIGNHILQVTAIAEGLAFWDPENARAYAASAQIYTSHLTVLKEWALRERMGFGNHKIALAHDGFSGLARELGLTVVAVAEAAHGSAPSAAEISAAINAIRSDPPKAMFAERGNPSAAASTIAEETGLPIFELEMITSGPAEKDAYMKAMERNVETLKRALE